MNLKERAKKLKADIPALFLTLKDKDTPMLAKILIGFTVAYALSPIDLIPDFIPFLGYLDDVLLLPCLIALSLKMIPKEVFEKNRAKVDQIGKDKIQKRWYYALPIIILWLLMIIFLVKIMS